MTPYSTRRQLRTASSEGGAGGLWSPAWRRAIERMREAI
jgi:hypothetical protein